LLLLGDCQQLRTSENPLRAKFVEQPFRDIPEYGVLLAFGNRTATSS
jgi:hypothetical protein